MAAITELWLRGGEQLPAHAWMMYRMTINAAYIVFKVFGPHEVRVLLAELMAFHATF